MKKILLILFLTASSTVTFAQTVNFGIKAGLNLSELSHSNPASYGSGLLPGYNFGGVACIDFKNFSIQPGIFFSTKGEKDRSEFFGGNSFGSFIASKTVLNYIEVPVSFLHKSQVAPGITFNFGGGPYIGYGLSENLSIVNYNPVQNYHNFGYRNPDYGINFVAGIEIKKGFTVDAGYGLGLANLLLDGSTTYNRVISLSVGYMFR